MDVAFKMKGARRVVIIDASDTGVDPGTVYQVPGHALEDLPALDGIHTHQFRWDHALSFGRWLLADDYPSDITVYLIEAAQVDPGAPLSDPVEAAMHQVVELIRSGWDGR
jgi:hydrogenase maturation protease